MADYVFIPMEFAKNGTKNVIQKVRQTGQDPQDMTWSDGSPSITLTAKEDGGLPPKGQDFNGVVNAISSHAIFSQNGNRYKWDANVVTEFGGYAKDAIVQSSDGSKEYISLIDNNQTNPESSTSGTWAIYSGQGSVPLATSTTTGVMRVLNVLTSTDVGSALSAAMGRFLKDLIDTKLNTSQALGINQSYTDTSNTSGNSYYNNTSKPIFVSISFRDSNVDSSTVAIVGGVVVANLPNIAGGTTAYQNLSFIVPPFTSYQVNSQNPITLWTELR